VNGTWTLQSGIAFQQVSSSANTFSRNANGTMFDYNSSNNTWGVLSIPITDVNNLSYNGQAKWVAAAPAAPLEVYGFVIANAPWTGGSSDDMILQILQSNSISDSAFSQVPSGAVQVSVAPGTGNPWTTSAENVGYVGRYYPQ
jgi:hypothetical protein